VVSCADGPREGIVHEAQQERNTGAALALTWARCASLSVGLSGVNPTVKVWLERRVSSPVSVRQQIVQREELALDAQGRWCGRGLTPGSWRLVVERGDLRREQPVSLGCGHNALDGMTAPRASAFWGRVMGGRGKPLEGAHIELRDGQSHTSISAQSGDDGSFVFEGIAMGHHRLTVVALGRRVLQRDVQVPGQVVLQTLRSQVVEGVVRGVSEQEVEVTLVGPALRRRTRVMANGQFEFQELLPGSYELVARTLQKPWLASALVVSRAGHGVVALTLEPATRLKGRVVGGKREKPNHPLAARVVLRPFRPVLFAAEVRADKRGRFTAPALPAGRYRVEAWADGWLPCLGETVTLPGTGEVITLRLRRGQRLSGRVMNADGKPLKGALVRVFPGGAALGPRIGELGVIPGRVPPIPDVDAMLPTNTVSGRLWSATTDIAGEFLVEGLPSAIVRYSIEHPGYQRVAGAVDLQRQSQVTLRLQAGRQVPEAPRDAQGHLAYVKSLRRVHGSVREWRTGAPVSRFSIGVGRGTARAFRDKRGQFSLMLAPGAQRLRVRGQGYAPSDVVVQEGNRSHDPLLIELRAAGSIQGSVRDALGQVVVGAEVRVVGLRGRGLSVQSDKGGRFTIKDVPEGTYNLDLSFGGETLQSDPISVRAGQRSGPVRFHLTRATYP